MTMPAVTSPAGRHATRLVGAARLASATCMGVAIVATGRLFDGGASQAWNVGLLFALGAGAFAFAEISFGGRAARAEERRLRRMLLDRYFTRHPETTARDDDAEPAHLVQLMTDNVERLSEYRQVYLGATLAAIAIPFVTLAYVGIMIDPVVGFGVMALVPVIPLAIGGFMRFFRATSAASRSERSHLAGRYLDAIRNLVVIRLMGAGVRVQHALTVQGDRNRRAIMRLLAGNQIVIIVMDGLIGLVFICLTAALTVQRADHLTDAQILAVMLLTVLLLEPLQQVAGFFYIGMGGMASQRALRAYVSTHDGEQGDATSDRRSASTPQRTPAGDGTEHGTEHATEADPTLAIEMRGVHFDYGRGPVLRDLNLTVPVGSRIAIMGRSGAGKSTLLSLLRGSAAPQRGWVAVAGEKPDATNPAATRALSATVMQSTWMFTGSIADNLRMARTDPNDAAIWSALEQAEVADEIRRMPNGLQTHLGEGAALISGGQAQRISLARALLSGRPVLLLDEPTSHVDIQSEAHIIDAVASLPADRTVLIVTHRASLLRCVDSAYELIDGRLEEMEVVGD